MELFLKYIFYAFMLIGSCFVILSMPTLYQNDDHISDSKHIRYFYIGFIFILLWLGYDVVPLIRPLNLVL